MESQKGLTLAETILVGILLSGCIVGIYFLLSEPKCEETAPTFCIPSTIHWDGDECECTTNQHTRVEW